MPKTTYTLAEAAKLLSCHPETLRRAIKDGSLRAARLGREYRVSRAEIQDFWTSRGGGELFDADEAPAEAVERKPRQRPRKKVSGPQQLSLLDPAEPGVPEQGPTQGAKQGDEHG